MTSWGSFISGIGSDCRRASPGPYKNQDGLLLSISERFVLTISRYRIVKQQAMREVPQGMVVLLKTLRISVPSSPLRSLQRNPAVDRSDMRRTLS